MRHAYIVCAGTPAKCVVFGWSEAIPVVGEAVILTDARMVIRWTGGGLFDLAVGGGEPVLTEAVPVTSCVVGQMITCSDAGASRLSA